MVPAGIRTPMRRALLLLPLLVLGAKPKTGCPDDMVRIPKKDVCVDRYEWPNKKGAKPAVAMTAVQSLWDKKAGDDKHNAEALCKSVGKRMCTMDEWVAGCRGKRNAPYPFGRKLPSLARTPADKTPCNYAKWYRKPDGAKVFKRDPKELARLDQSDKSGARAKCKSASGAHDMMGNVEEWIRCPRYMTKSGGNCVGKDGDSNQVCYCLAGRYWSSPVKCHRIIAGHAAQYHDYETGFRCCKDAG